MVKSMNEKSRIELLAPAGSWEALDAGACRKLGSSGGGGERRG